MKTATHHFNFDLPKIRRWAAFTLVEVLVVVVLLSLIVIALMAVFNSTQTAFRASITQTDVLEGGRAAMDLITTDLKQMSPSLGESNVNFYAAVPSGYTPLVQSMTASPDNQQRTNVLENIFILSRGNQSGVPTWYGTGYAVYVSPTNLYSLYRFYSNCPVAAAGAPASLFNDFQSSVSNPLLSPNSYSYLMDGVVELRVRAYDANGVWMSGSYTNAENFQTNGMLSGETGFYMFSNTLPATVEIEMAALEDRTLQRAESLGIAGQLPWSASAQWSYLTNHVGQLHIFRQRVSIPNVDPAAYQ